MQDLTHPAVFSTCLAPASDRRHAYCAAKRRKTRGRFGPWIGAFQPARGESPSATTKVWLWCARALAGSGLVLVGRECQGVTMPPRRNPTLHQSGNSRLLASAFRRAERRSRYERTSHRKRPRLCEQNRAELSPSARAEPLEKAVRRFGRLRRPLYLVARAKPGATCRGRRWFAHSADQSS